MGEQLPFCTRCGGDFPDDVGFCPYCNRSFVAKTLGGPGGFKPEEIPEYLARKTEAIGITLFGLLVMIGGSIFIAWTVRTERYVPFIGTISEPNWLAVALTLLTGLIIFAYGAHLWNKITHIMWTRQALREYGVPSTILKDASDQISPNQAQVLLEKEEIERYLDSLDRQLAEGKISEATYKALREKYEVELKQITEGKILQSQQSLYIPIDRGKFRKKDGSTAEHFDRGKLKIDQKGLHYVSDRNDKTIELSLENVKGISLFGLLGNPFGVIVTMKDSLDYQFYIDASDYDMAEILRSLKDKIESADSEKQVDLSKIAPIFF